MSEIKLFNDTRAEEAFGVIKKLYPTLPWLDKPKGYEPAIRHHFRARSLHEAYWLIYDAYYRLLESKDKQISAPVKIKVGLSDVKSGFLEFGAIENYYRRFYHHGLAPDMSSLKVSAWRPHTRVINSNTAEWFVRLTALRYLDQWRRYSEYSAHSFVGLDRYSANSVRSWLVDSSISYSLVRSVATHGSEYSDIMNKILTETNDLVFWFYVVGDILVTVDFPARVDMFDGHLGMNGRAAIEWSDGAEVWAIDGILDSKKHLVRRLTLDRIFNERSAEIRKRLIEEYGAQSFFAATNAKCISNDERGKLWSVQGLEADVLEVENSTPNSDGSPKKYYLLVARGYRTAANAVAASFGSSEDVSGPRRTIWGGGGSRIVVPVYNPVVET